MEELLEQLEELAKDLAEPTFVLYKGSDFDSKNMGFNEGQANAAKQLKRIINKAKISLDKLA